MKYTRLEDLGYRHTGKNYEKFHSVKCDCGTEKVVRLAQLKSGKTKSCGCLGREQTKLREKTHGMRKTRIYSIWCNIKHRCKTHKKPTCFTYRDKGITYENRWEKFENFWEDMGLSYEKHVKEFGSKQTTIERIDSNAGYNSKNCKWATYSEQNKNRSTFLRNSLGQVVSRRD